MISALGAHNFNVFFQASSGAPELPELRISHRLRNCIVSVCEVRRYKTPHWLEEWSLGD